MNFTYKNNKSVQTTDVRVYTGDKYGDQVYLVTRQSLYDDLKYVWADDEAVTLENLDFEGQTTEIDDYINLDNYLSEKSWFDSVQELLQTEMTSAGDLWGMARKYITKQTGIKSFRMKYSDWQKNETN